jgi:hypothetical protein
MSNSAMDKLIGKDLPEITAPGYVEGIHGKEADKIGRSAGQEIDEHIQSDKHEGGIMKFIPERFSCGG